MLQNAQGRQKLLCAFLSVSVHLKQQGLTRQLRFHYLTILFIAMCKMLKHLGTKKVLQFVTGQCTTTFHKSMIGLAAGKSWVLTKSMLMQHITRKMNGKVFTQNYRMTLPYCLSTTYYIGRCIDHSWEPQSTPIYIPSMIACTATDDSTSSWYFLTQTNFLRFSRKNKEDCFNGFKSIHRTTLLAYASWCALI